MSRVKRIIITACIMALGVFALVGLSGCGDTAATWEHGKVTEEEVTTAATNEMSQFMNSDGVTYDVDGWYSYIANRSYVTDGSAQADGTGTLEEYRTYLVNQIVREQLIEYEIEEAGIEVTDEEVDERVDSYAAMYEAYYGGGHAGTFESILEMYMGMDLDTFKESVRDGLLQEKYQMQVCGVETAEEIDSAKFEAYIDSLMAYADVKVKGMPDELSYDPAVVSANQEGIVTDAAQAETDATTEESQGSQNQ